MSENRKLVGLKYTQGHSSKTVTVYRFDINLDLDNEATSMKDKPGCVEWIDDQGFTHQIPNKNIFDRVYVEDLE